MTPETTIAVLGLLFTIPAIPFLWRTLRQIKASDTVMYATIDDDEPDYTANVRPVSPVRARVMGIILVFVFVSVAASVGITVMAATAPTQVSAGKTAAKCPF